MASHFASLKNRGLRNPEMAYWSACRNRRLFHTSNIYNDRWRQEEEEKKEIAIKRNTKKES